MRLVSADEQRTLDAATIAAGTPGHVLMERAGAGAVRVILECFPRLRRTGRRVLVVAGTGNNGGDGLVIARLLAKRGAVVEVAILGAAAALRGDAERNLGAYRRLRKPLFEVVDGAGVARVAAAGARADLIVDALFGTGLNRSVQGLAAQLIEAVNACGTPVLAVDIPSGLDADTGQVLGAAIQAQATATFGFAKLGQLQHPGVRHCGALAVVDIGLAAAALAAPPCAALLDAAGAAALLPQRDAEAHKGTCGHVLVLAGSFGHTGAAQLATRAAGRAGAGLVTVVAPASLYPVYAAGVREAMTEALPDDDGRIRFDPVRLAALAAGKAAIVVGPGLGTHTGAAETVRWLLAEARVPLLLDADALTLVAANLAALRGARAPLVLTPHPGEMGRLAGIDTAAVQADRVGVARRFASAHGCVLVLKGARTVIAAPDGFVWINPTGNPGMASGGMGDVLAGAIGALLAQGLTTSAAASVGAYVHGAAGDAAAADGEIGLLAGDVAEALRPALHRLRAALDGAG